jgi:hypothetical protein
MQGRAFLGPQRRDPRRYVYATRDRFDEAYDMVRAVRNRRFKYICNFRPEQPYLLWIPYRNRHPIMQEIWRLHGEDRLEGPQKLLLQNRRPVEELYDTEADPFELNNLALNPSHRAELEEMREVMKKWQRKVKDMGDLSEAEMVRRWWPGGTQPVTATPVFIPIGPDRPGMETATDRLETRGPLHLQLHCATQGGSIAWTTATEENPHWQLYTGPVRLESGTTTLRAVAHRIGFKPSAEAALQVTVG